MTDERHDDEVLGRALSRAIETQAPNETPFERSRIGSAPARYGFPIWQTLGVVAALVLALAFGSWFTRSTDTGPVAASPSATASTPTLTSAPASSVPASSTVRVYFVRDGLPPVSAMIPGPGLDPLAATAKAKVANILTRLLATREAVAGAVPTGTMNPLGLVGRGTTLPSGSSGFAVEVGIVGDTANVGFDGGWNVHGAAQVQALVQQLVYVITEEPGIRRAMILDKGKTNAVIDGLVVSAPLTREDVTDYDTLGSTTTVQGFGDSSKAGARKLTTSTSVETVAPGLARFVISTDLANVSPTQLYPDFKVEVVQNDETANPLGGKWRMVVTVNGSDATTGTQVINKSPLRTVIATTPKCLGCSETIYELGLDDLRPWRTAIELAPFRIIIDIGGDPRTMTGSNAVFAPAYGATVGRTFQVSGIQHNFEAHVIIAVRDEKDTEILRTFTVGTNCCDPGGTFEKTIELPAGVSGRITLEVFDASARDGSVIVLIRIPLTVR